MQRKVGLMMKGRFSRLILSISILIMLVGGLVYTYEKNLIFFEDSKPASAENNILDVLGKWEGELSGGKYYSLVDEKGTELDQTNHEVYIGDEFIVEDNTRYKVVEVDEKNLQAKCEKVGMEDIKWLDEWDNQPVLELAQKSNSVAIYMTHSDESYKPTSGTESKPGKGDILQIGKTLAAELKKQGVKTNISLNTHDPHDANAYHRSRKTAAQLLKNNPTAIIDVHRDGVPDPNFYKAEIDGKPGTKIRLVVGRQNPHMSSNLEFAKQIKAYYDKKYPGLIKGIFMAKGNYNQDLAPRSVILEVGTYTNSRKEAETGIVEFADGLPKMLGIASGTGIKSPTAPRGTPSSGAGSAMLWLLLLVVVGGGAFLFISTGSVKGSMQKLSGIGKEFANYLGPIRKKGKKDE